MKTILTIIFVTLIGGISAKLYLDNRGFTPWMTMKEMDAFIKPMEKKDDKGKAEWDHLWITDIQARWHQGYAQYRLRVENGPKGVPYWWYWYYNLDRESLIKKLEDMRNQNFQLVSISSYTWPEGTPRYCVVWHRVGKQ